MKTRRRSELARPRDASGTKAHTGVASTGRAGGGSITKCAPCRSRLVEEVSTTGVGEEEQVVWTGKRRVSMTGVGVEKQVT